VVNLKLWQEDIAKVDSVIVNEKSSSKTLDVEVKNCDNYNVEVSLGGKMYTGVGSLGLAEVAINDISTEEKTLVIRLTAPNMNDFRKTLKVKKTTENIQEKKIDVTTLMLWGRDIKEKDAIVVNATDAPKTLEIGVSNCDDYAVSAKIDNKEYTGNATSGVARIEIADLPTEEKSLEIKLVATGKENYTKSLTVKKDVQNTQPKDFAITKIKLWGRDVKDLNSIVVSEKDAPKTLEIGVSNCDDYAVSAKIDNKEYTGNATSGVASIEIADLPTEEKSLEIKLTSGAMQTLTKTIRVKKEVENTEPKEFDVTRIRLWGHNIKEENSVVVNAKDVPKVLELEASNCNEYKIDVNIGDKNYTGNASSGKARIEIADIPTEEKSLVIKLTGKNMKEFTKSLKVKKTTENIQLEDFNVTKIKLWGHDIKDETSLIVNGKDAPKTLIIEVANCADYGVNVTLGSKTYTGDSNQGKVSIEIADIPKGERDFSIKLSASGKNEWNKTLKVKKVDLDFSLYSLTLWGHNIKTKSEIEVLITDEPKKLELMVTNCDEYLVTASLNGKEYTGNATSGSAEIEIKGIPSEEKELTIKLSALGMNDWVKTIKVKRVKPNFAVSTLKLWGNTILFEDALMLDGHDMPRTLQVVAGNCDEYLVTVSLDGKEYTKNTTSGSAEIEIKDIPLEEKEMSIKLSSSDMNDFVKTLRVKKELIDASDLKVFFKTSDDNIEKEVAKDGNPEFSTTQPIGEVIIKTAYSIMKSAKINGDNATLSQDKKTATYNIDTTSDVNVNVEVEFEDFKKAERTFRVKKYTNQNDIPFECTSAKIVSGDGEEVALSFDSSNKASVRLENIHYSTVKLVMQFNKELASREVLECKDQRTGNYSTNFFTPTALSGTFSGYITHDVNFQTGEETELKCIDGKTYTEILIAGYGTVSYKTCVASKTKGNKTYTIEIVNPIETMSEDQQSLDTDYFMKNSFRVSNGHTGWGTFYGFARQLNGFFLPFYYKGPNWKDGRFGGAGFVDPAYMESLNLVIVDRSATDKFCFYYNVMGEEGGIQKDEGKFKRITALGRQGSGYIAWTNIKDLDGKYLDCFMSGKETLPNPMYTFLYGKKWRKTSNRHGWLLKLNNKQESHWEGQAFPSGNAFDWIFNYRMQAMSYDEQNKAGGENKYLTIAKNQDFAYWETGAKEGGDTNGWAPFLSGKEGDEKDVFKFFPLCKVEDVKEVRCTIKKGNDEASCVPETDYENVLLSAVNENNETFYRLGCKANETTPSYTFKEGVYKVEIEVTYKDNEAQKDKFRYILDYTNNQHKIELMNLVGEEDVNTNLFGVPTSYSSTRMPEFDIMKKRTTQDFLKMKTYR